jgi:ferredoxin-NADP reductase
MDTKITLFYGCRTEADVAFKTELEELAKKNSKFKLMIVLSQASSDWKGAAGYINAEMVQKEVPDFKDTVFFACGPPPMVTAMQGLVEKLGLPKEQLKLELFTGYT